MFRQGSIPFERLPELAKVAEDRLCPGCGHNLRNEAIRQDPGTLAFLTRCPRCGRFEPMVSIPAAAQLWLYRCARLVMTLWISLMGVGLVGLILAEAAVPGYVLARLTTHAEGGHLILHARYTRYSDEYLLLMVYSLAGSAAVGFVGVVMATVLFPHWPRWGGAVLAVTCPAVAALFQAVFWYGEEPALLGVFLKTILAQALAQMAGGTAGFLGGRRLARLLGRVFLPPRVRVLLGSLWTADAPVSETPRRRGP
ncbi:MAG: hypothetical protein HY718_01085 [Planctomycetes bacterium]|nr:hypothetical protein [Planctomycetota bacterium]